MPHDDILNRSKLLPLCLKNLNLSGYLLQALQNRINLGCCGKLIFQESI